MCLDELDDYLRDYKFSPDTLMSMVCHYMEEGIQDPSSFDEVVGDVDRFLWRFAEAGSIRAETFVALVKVPNLNAHTIINLDPSFRITNLCVSI